MSAAPAHAAAAVLGFVAIDASYRSASQPVGRPVVIDKAAGDLDAILRRPLPEPMVRPADWKWQVQTSKGQGGALLEYAQQRDLFFATYGREPGIATYAASLALVEWWWETWRRAYAVNPEAFAAVYHVPRKTSKAEFLLGGFPLWLAHKGMDELNSDGLNAQANAAFADGGAMHADVTATRLGKALLDVRSKVVSEAASADFDAHAVIGALSWVAGRFDLATVQKDGIMREAREELIDTLTDPGSYAGAAGDIATGLVTRVGGLAGDMLGAFFLSKLGQVVIIGGAAYYVWSRR